MTRNIPELLAPAGNREAFEAAIASGADAVYLGAGNFNARQNADNFSMEDLQAACRDAHLRRRKVYLTANTLIMPGEMDEAFRMVSSAAEAGIDAAIIQDVGLMNVLRHKLPQLELHTSTQMNIRSEAGIEFAKRLGASRVTLARELSIEQIAELAKCGIDLEVFVHGALCICQSGQCLLSSLIGGRSANRGQCAQPCRLPYSLVNAQGKKMSDLGEYLLSPHDLMGIELLPQLIDAGVASLKIEGRMKSIEYVSTVTHIYREALDRAYVERESFQATDEEKDQLADAFSRGFSKAYLVGENGNEMMGYKRPNNRGLVVGRVSGFKNGFVHVNLTQEISVGDLLEVWTKKGRVTYEVTLADKIDERKAELNIRGAVSINDRIFRVRSAKLAQSVKERTERGMQSEQINISVRACLNEPLSITISDNYGIEASAQGAIVEAARTKALTREDIIEHVGRLGGTPYVCDNWEVELIEGVGLGFSALHKLRKKAIEAYEDALLASLDKQRSTAAKQAQVLDTRENAPQSEIAHFVTRLNSQSENIAFDLDSFKPGKNIGPKLYACNLESLKVWAALGANFAWLSPELTLAQIKKLADNSPLPLGITVYGRQELMISDHCFLMAEGPCAKNCSSCARRNGEQLYLRDRKNYEFPVTTDENGKGHLYNSVVFDACHAIPDLMNAGVRAFAIDDTLLNDFDAEQQYYRARRAMQGKRVKKEEGTTVGNLFRNRKS